MSQDTELGGQLSRPGLLPDRAASAARSGCSTRRGASRDGPTARARCPTLAGDPTVAAGGAKLVVASRSDLIIYRMSMASGRLAVVRRRLPVQPPDRAAGSLRGVDRLQRQGRLPGGLCLRLPPAGGEQHRMAHPGGPARRRDDVQPLVLGSNATYTSVFDETSDQALRELRRSPSTRSSAGSTRSSPSPTVDGFAVPDYAAVGLLDLRARRGGPGHGGLERRPEPLRDGGPLRPHAGRSRPAPSSRRVERSRSSTSRTSVVGEPRMALQGVVRTCLGAGQIRRLPGRAGQGRTSSPSPATWRARWPSSTRRRAAVVRYVGLDPATGSPGAGALRRSASRSSPSTRRGPPSRSRVPATTPSPCATGRDCQRIYVASFLNNWVNVLELDPDQPSRGGAGEAHREGPVKRLAAASRSRPGDGRLLERQPASSRRGSAGPVAIAPFIGMQPRRAGGGARARFSRSPPSAERAATRRPERPTPRCRDQHLLGARHPHASAPVPSRVEVASRRGWPTCSWWRAPSRACRSSAPGSTARGASAWSETIDLSGVEVGQGAQILSLAVAAVPAGPPAGNPPVAPRGRRPGLARRRVQRPGGAWQRGRLVVLEMAAPARRVHRPGRTRRS